MLNPPSCAMAISSLRKQGYAIIRGSEYSLENELAQSLSRARDSWQRLPVDRYMRDGETYRKRRYGGFELNRETGSLTPLSAAAFYQSKTVNKYAGGVTRHFSDLEENTKASNFLRQIIFAHAEIIGQADETPLWNIGVHQIRVTADVLSAGLPTPEGIHQDGHSFISIVLIGRSAVNGGITTIYDKDKIPLIEYTLSEPLDSLIANDRILFHGVTPITASHQGLGHRDVLILDFNT